MIKEKECVLRYVTNRYVKGYRNLNAVSSELSQDGIPLFWDMTLGQWVIGSQISDVLRPIYPFR
jgi:hypothetical protein